MNEEKNPYLAFLVAYLVPGLGHFYLGKRKKAIFLTLILCCTFLYGFYLCDFGNIAIFDRNITGNLEFRPSFLAQAGIGLFAWIPALRKKFKISIREDSPRIVEPSSSRGMLYMMVAGLLNILVAQNAYELATKKSGKKGK